MKICKKCECEKDNSLFPIRIKRPGRPLASWCKQCYSDYNTIQARKGRAQRAYQKRKNDPVLNKKINDRQRELNIQNRERYLHRHAKARAKKKELEFNIDVEDIIIPDFCPILRVPISKGTMDKKDWNMSTIDRIDNSKGYIKGNVMVISRKANVMKNSATSKELKAFCDYFRRVEENGIMDNGLGN